MTPPSGYVGLFIDQATGNLVRKSASGITVDVGSTAPGNTAPVNGEESGVIISSTGNPDMSGGYFFAGVGALANYYFSTAYPDTHAVYRNSETGKWLIAYSGISFDQEATPSNRFESADDVEYPWLVTTWIGYGDLSGESVTSVEEDPGVTATTSPPYIRTAGGYLYIQEAGVWKKAALSALE